MSSKPHISIVIPVYNVGSLLSTCLDSILNQDFKQIEIICVNDGSIDDSVEILQEYENKYSIIRVFHQENKGAAAARNTGIMHALGKYILFLDADDYILPGLLKKLTSKNADLGVFGTQIKTPPGLENEIKYKYLQDYFSLPESGIYYNSSLTYNHIYCGPHKLWKKSIIQKHGILFPEGYLYEDGAFHREYVKYVKTIHIIQPYSYMYVQRMGSSMNKPQKKGNDKELDALRNALNIFPNKERELPSRFMPEYFDYLQIEAINSYVRYHDEEKDIALEKIREMLVPYMEFINKSAARPSAKRFFNDVINGNWPYNPDSPYMNRPGDSSYLFPLFKLLPFSLLANALANIPNYEKLRLCYTRNYLKILKKLFSCIPVAKWRRKSIQYIGEKAKKLHWDL